jgi:hypothetical protein
MIESVLLSYFLHHFGLPAQRDPLTDIPAERGQVIVEVQQPSVHSIQLGSQRVPMLTLAVQASCDASVGIESIQVRRRGLGQSTDISAVYAMANGTRLNRSSQLNRAGFTQLRFRNLTVAACEKLLIQVMADFAEDAQIAGEHWFEVVSPSDIATTATSVKLLSGKEQVRRSTGGGPSVGVISVEYPRLLTTVRYGAGRTVARLRLSADGSNDHAIHSITLTNDGSARNSNLQNIVLRAGRNRHISAVLRQMQKDKVKLVLKPPLLLSKNQSRLLEVQADVRASRSRTLKLIIEQSSDIEAQVVRRRQKEN